MQSTLSQRQFAHGYCSTTSQRTLRALQEAQARAARRLVILLFAALGSVFESARFLDGESFGLDVAVASETTSATSAFTSAGCKPGVDADADLDWNSTSSIIICAIVKSSAGFGEEMRVWNREGRAFLEHLTQQRHIRGAWASPK